MNIKITNIQLALFSPGINLSDKVDLLTKIKKNAGKYLDGDPIVLPVPVGAPPEIPLLVLKDKSGNISLNISVNKIGLFIHPADEKGKVPEVYTDLISELETIYKNILSALYGSTELAVNRIGFVVKGESEIQKTGKQLEEKYLSAKFAKTKWQKINLGLLKKDNIDKKTSNIWFRINSDMKKDGSGNKNKIIIIFDTNTVAYKSYIFKGIDDVLSYVKQAILYLESYSKKVLI